jgi:CheY-like chemotaxis protein
MTMHKPVCVYVVDDSATSCLALKKQLLQIGCDVMTENDDEKALAFLCAAHTHGHFDLVLLDCFMPVIDGFEFVRRLRACEATLEWRHLPVIGISGDSDHALKQRCIESGMDGVLTKPLSQQTLQNMVDLWCVQGIQTSTSTTVLTEDIAQIFSATSKEDCAALIHAFSQADIERVLRLIHRMKGAAMTMHATEMAATLKRIEASLRGGSESVSLLHEDMIVLTQQIDAL